MKRAKILSASAGSGKTYQLALKYICDIIERPDRYRNILAVTFTNKATEEMKSRILNEIHILASGGKSIYIDKIAEELNMSEPKIRECALKVRTRILHDYSRFTILTIDRFFQRILRAFIKELSLDLNYNIELDTTLLLERSADMLVESIAEEPEVRRWLLEFAEERINDGTRWDMRSDLCHLGEELFRENGAKRINTSLGKKELRDAVNSLIKESEVCKHRLKDLGEQALGVMAKYGVVASQFKSKSKSAASNFAIYAAGELKAPNATMLKAADNINEWYGKDADGNTIAAASELMPILNDICRTYTKGINKINTAKLVRDNYRSFALLSDLQRNITNICDEENIMILSKTKDILSTFVDDSNAPFIYEKVGSRYDHYMIDEFQDTSVREWQNMLPLLKEALASNRNASVFIVGDIKQSIYRWRGGDWRLLNSGAIADLGRENVEVVHLKNNYRSLENVVTFNNEIIARVVDMDNAHLNKIVDNALKDRRISNATHSSLYNIVESAYCDHKQEPVTKEEDKGYVEVCAFDPSCADSPFIEAIESAISRGYRYRDILILVRKSSDAKRVADALFEYKDKTFTSRGEAGFNVLTPDSLTLEGCDITEFIVAVLRLAINQHNDIERGVYNRFLGYNLDHTFDDNELDLMHRLAHLSPMEAFEQIVSYFNLHERKQSIAFLQAMHDQIINFSTTRITDIQHYLMWWDERGKNEAVKVEMTDDTIEITTIHKAKGLERDVVIIPYASIDMVPRSIHSPIVWAKADDPDGSASTLGDFPVCYGGAMEESAFSEEYYKELVMSHVDGINLLYVAITRASRELYLFFPKNLHSKTSSDNIATTVPLIWNAVQDMCHNPETVMSDGETAFVTYKIGVETQAKRRSSRNDTVENVLLNDYITNRPNIKVRFPVSRYIDECGGQKRTSINAGLRLHSIFEHAVNEADLLAAIDKMVLDCVIDENEAITLQQNVNKALESDVIKEWFNGEWDDVKIEADIILRNKQRRPDRVMFKGDRAVVVDYKFGELRSPKYAKQVAEYMSLLVETGRYNHIEGYVWYLMTGELECVEQ